MLRRLRSIKSMNEKSCLVLGDETSFDERLRPSDINNFAALPLTVIENLLIMNLYFILLSFYEWKFYDIKLIRKSKTLSNRRGLICLFKPTFTWLKSC